MTILIYEDYKNNHAVLYKSLCRQFGTDDVAFCDAADILAGVLDKGVRMLVMPGGADLYYVERLNGEGNKRIRRFVEGGGCYLGICAGAYYAAAYVEWARDDQELAICGARELSFFPGIARGPAYEVIEDGDAHKSWKAAIELQYDDGRYTHESLVLYHGGPLFSASTFPADDSKRLRILARYADLPGQPAAIVECRVGKGKAVLCSPHLEVAPEDAAKSLYRFHTSSHDWEAGVVKALNGSATGIRKIWSHVLERALTPVADEDDRNDDLHRFRQDHADDYEGEDDLWPAPDRENAAQESH